MGEANACQHRDTASCEGIVFDCAVSRTDMHARKRLESEWAISYLATAAVRSSGPIPTFTIQTSGESAHKINS
jgi:hypothetical protein